MNIKTPKDKVESTKEKAAGGCGNARHITKIRPPQPIVKSVPTGRDGSKGLYVNDDRPSRRYLVCHVFMIDKGRVVFSSMRHSTLYTAHPLF